MNEPRPVDAGDTLAISLTETFRVASRHYLASEHLWRALHDARRAESLERELVQRPGFDVEYRACVIGAVQAAVAFMEALVNELFEDARDSAGKGQMSSRLGSLDAGAIESMAEFWETAERSLDLPAKLQMALLLAGGPRFDRGAAPFQDIPLLVQLRNALVHFKPAWHEHDGSDRWEAKLASRIKPTPLMAGAGNPWFPGKCISADCAAWACRVAREVADEWTTRLGVPAGYTADLAEWQEP